MMKWNRWLLLIVLVNISFAQYTTTAKIKPVPQSGFYKITLPPALRSFTTQDLSNFRIYNSKGNEIPYFVLQQKNPVVTSTIEEFPILSQSSTIGKKTTLVFENPAQIQLNKIALVISNTDGVKKYSISGSNDNFHWFGIVNNKILSDITNIKNTATLKTITFPLCSYRFLKIDFDDSKTLPVDIQKIGIIRTAATDPKEQLLPLTPQEVTITHLTKEKKTLVHVWFKNKQVINQLTLDIQAPAFYKRNARMYKKITYQHKRKVWETEQDLWEFQIDSDAKKTIAMPQLFEKDFFIAIENLDNPPLAIASLNFSQIPLIIVANFKNNETYTAKIGGTTRMPQYDLAFFKDKIQDQLPETEVYQIKSENVQQKIIKQNQFWQQPWFMWLCIAIGGITILYFSISLIKDINKN